MENEIYETGNNDSYKPTLDEQRKLLDDMRHIDWGMQYRMVHNNKK